MIDRYTLPEMAAVWTLQSRYEAWLEVEIAACEAWAELGVIPAADARLVRERARVDAGRALALEKETRHDVVAFTRAVSETLGPERKWVHYGLTSTDVVDTALGVQLLRANALLFSALRALLATLRKQAVRYKDTLMMGRTHGVHAEPTTFGLKLAVFHAEMTRNLGRLERAAEGVRYGKLSGAVGTYANIDPRVEEIVCARLGLKPAPISTQTLQRDRHAEYLAVLALIGTSLDKIATEIRGLQKTEIREVEEPFYKGQKGSSAMPHKRNPVNCEQIGGLARVLRGHMQAAYENVPLWHERDISHSSAERVILPDSTLLVHYMLTKMDGILAGLTVFPDNMKRNMDRSLGLIFSQRVMNALIERGVGREEAYDAVQERAMQAWEERRPFRELVAQAVPVRERLTDAELDACFDPAFHVRHVDLIFRRLGLLEADRPEAGSAPDEAPAPEPVRGPLIYEGKAKRVYAAGSGAHCLVEFKDDATAFNGEKKGTIGGKGEVNARISAILFGWLEAAGIRTHFVRQTGARELLVRRVRIVPLEVVVRNIAAGSLAKRLGMAEGTELPGAVVEFYYKDDALGDPLVNRSHARALAIANDEEMDELERLALRINDELAPHLRGRGLMLVDFKLEFGALPGGGIVLADEISPDTCRFWDVRTGERLDKDRFRRDLGGVEDAYREVLRRLEEGRA